MLKVNKENSATLPNWMRVSHRRMQVALKVSVTAKGLKFVAQS